MQSQRRRINSSEVRRRSHHAFVAFALLFGPGLSWVTSVAGAGEHFVLRLDLPRTVEATPGGPEVAFFGEALLAQIGVGEESGAAAEAWSLAVAADGDGCAISAFSLAGTASEVGEDGWSHAERTASGGVVVAVILGVEQRASLPLTEGPHSLLGLEFRGEIPEGTPCSECQVRFVDGLQGSGRPVRNVVTASDRSYRPTLDARRVELHPPVSATPVDLEVDAEGPKTLGPATFGACLREARFVVRAATRRVLALQLLGADSGDRNRIVVRRLDGGAPALEGAVSGSSSANPSMVVRLEEPGEHEVLVQSLFVQGATSTVRVRARLVDVAVERISAERGVRGGAVHLGLAGLGFHEGSTRFVLAGGPGSIEVAADDVRFLSPGRADAVFDLSSLDETFDDAFLDLVSRQVEGGTVVFEHRLEGAFQVKSPAFAHGLEVRVEGHDRYAFDRDSPLWIRLRNVSDGEVPAPIFRVRGAVGDAFRVVGEESLDASPQAAVLLGTAGAGPAGVIPPGTERWMPLAIRSRQTENVGTYGLELELDLFTPGIDDAIGWESLPPPPGGEAEWDRIRGTIGGLLGETWGEFANRARDIATRLARRRGDSPSIRQVFRYACARALDRPAGAIVGRVLRWDDLQPLQRARVEALRTDGSAAGCALTGADGVFAIEGLDEGETYRVRMDRPTIGGDDGLEAYVPEGDDLLGLDLFADPETPPDDECPMADESGLPAGLPEIPDELFTPVGRYRALVVSALDPNDKRARVRDPLGTVAQDEEIIYTITIENEGDAAAQRVEIVDTLGEALDPESVRPLEVAFGRHILNFDRGTSWPGPSRVWSETLRLSEDSWSGVSIGPSAAGTVFFKTDETDAEMKLDASVVTDPAAGTVTWILQTLDPDTGEPPIDPSRGILQPEDGTGRGQGHVSFGARVRRGRREGDSATNKAGIKFDQQGVIQTRETANTFTENPAPESPERPAPGDDGWLHTGEAVSWEPSAFPTVRYDVFLRRGGSPWMPSPAVSSLPVSVWTPPALERDTPYEWQVVARNARAGTPDEVDGDSQTGPVWRFRTYPGLPGAAAALRTLDPEAERPTLEWRAGAHTTSCAVSLWPAGMPMPPAPSVVLDCGPGEPVTWSPTLPLDPGHSRWSWMVVGRNAAAPAGWSGSESRVVTFPDPVRPPAIARFVRGDANADGIDNISDAIFILNFLFLGGTDPTCLESLDVNDDGGDPNIADPIYLLAYLFLGGPPPKEPHDGCGWDPTADSLRCEDFAACP